MTTMYRILLFLMLLHLSVDVLAQDIQRFPPPDFESGYTFPEITTPEPRSEIMGYVDIALLVVALSVGTYLIMKKRERKWVFLLACFSLIYFGFIREGCICSIGAIQNVGLAFADRNYTLPIAAAAFFVIPLIFTLFFWPSFLCRSLSFRRDSRSSLDQANSIALLVDPRLKHVGLSLFRRSRVVFRHGERVYYM